jgi:hypothetical protein
MKNEGADADRERDAEEKHEKERRKPDYVTTKRNLAFRKALRCSSIGHQLAQIDDHSKNTSSSTEFPTD